jgi:hypothetical protein
MKEAISHKVDTKISTLRHGVRKVPRGLLTDVNYYANHS